MKRGQWEPLVIRPHEGLLFRVRFILRCRGPVRKGR
jgi:hypothetical protein